MKVYTLTEPPDGDSSRGWALLAVCWVFVTLAFASTLLRIWVRSRLTKNLGSDDWIMCVAMFTTVIGAALITSEVIVGGLGRHAYYLTQQQLHNFRVLGWVDWMQTFITLGLTKISICLFLLRIIDTRPFKIFLYLLIAFLALFTSIFLFLFLGICRPIQSYWQIDPIDGVCMSERQIRNIVIAQGVLSIITDLICAGFPILFLRRLQIKRRVKLALCFLMGLGIITAICCFVRTVLSDQITHKDITWDTVPNIAWRLPEVNIGILCANAPILRPLYLFFHGKLNSKGRTYNQSNTAKTETFKTPSNAQWRSLDNPDRPVDNGSTTLADSHAPQLMSDFRMYASKINGGDTEKGVAAEDVNARPLTLPSLESDLVGHPSRGPLVFPKDRRREAWE